MGKGRDKRKKKEDPEKAVKRAARQAAKLNKGKRESEGTSGLNNEEAPEVTLSKIEKQQKKLKRTEEVEVPPPSPRVNVVFIPHPERVSDLVLFGGEFWDGEVTEVYNDTLIYNTKKNTWTKVVTPNNPLPRSSSQAIVYKHNIILFGGEFVSQSQSQYHHFKDTWRFDSRRSEWEELKSLKGGPSARSGHRMVLWKRKAVVFGGFYDNAQECHFYDDLHILSQLEDVGRWQKVELPSFLPKPCPRSGHTMCIHENTCFVYGGYSTEKFNRFKKSEATVHHDLWMIDLLPTETTQEDNPLRWKKIKLGGIPPPIRSGVASAFKDKRMFIFGGVVDVESPGGKVVSTFSNDLFVFHMDTQRFYPIILSGAKKRGGEGKAKKGVNDLSEELEALHLKVASESSSSQSTNDDDEDDEEAERDGTNEKEASDVKDSFEVKRNGSLQPLRRMDAALAIVGNYLYLYGGQFEIGPKEITLSDLYRLNISRKETYEILVPYDLSSKAWIGKESESDNNSWESGSTVVSAAFDLAYYDDDDDDDEDDEEEEEGVNFAKIPRQVELNEEDDGDEAPLAIPAEFHMDVTPTQDQIADSITRQKGKKGLQVHKEQLMAQLSDSAVVPTPHVEEDFVSFWEKSQAFWLNSAMESSEEFSQKGKETVRCAKRFARQRFDEAKELLRQLKLVEEQEAEEARFFRERRLQKEKEWMEYEAEQARQEAEGSTSEGSGNASEASDKGE